LLFGCRTHRPRLDDVLRRLLGGGVVDELGLDLFFLCLGCLGLGPASAGRCAGG